MVVCTTSRTTLATGFLSFTPSGTNTLITTVYTEQVKDPLTTWSLVGIQSMTGDNTFNMEFVIKLDVTLGVDQDILQFNLTSTAAATPAG